jgi:hypothetical protein
MLISDTFVIFLVLYTEHNKAASPIVKTESYPIIAVIDPKQGWDIMNANILNAFIQTDIEKMLKSKKTIMKHWKQQVDMLVGIAPNKYQDFVCTEGNHKVLNVMEKIGKINRSKLEENTKTYSWVICFIYRWSQSKWVTKLAKSRQDVLPSILISRNTSNWLQHANNDDNFYVNTFEEITAHPIVV